MGKPFIKKSSSSRKRRKKRRQFKCPVRDCDETFPTEKERDRHYLTHLSPEGRKQWKALGFR